MALPFTVVTPTEVEAGYLRGLGDVVVSGVGEGAATRAVAALEGDVSAIVLAGFCGGLADGLAVADVVVPERVIDEAGEAIVVDVGEGLSTGHTLVTVNAVVTQPADKRTLGARTGADAADMESVAFLRACAGRGMAGAVVRAVSDGVDDALPASIGDWVTPEGKSRVSAALGWAGVRPGRLAELTRLKARADRAGASLREAVIRLSETWPPDGSRV
ncbi:MAG: hypothetical protein AAF078_12935 [Planctomycetota bacterium]